MAAGGSRAAGLAAAALVVSVAHAAGATVPLPLPNPHRQQPSELAGPPTEVTAPSIDPRSADDGAAEQRQAPDADRTDCTDALKALGGELAATELPEEAQGECRIDEPVRLASIRDADGGVVDLPGRPLLSCRFARRFADFAGDLVAPLARGATGTGAEPQSLTAIETGPGFECRRRNRSSTGKISSHARGTAIDVAAFVMADGSRWSVGGASSAPGARTIDAIRTAACGWFTTVLGPGSDASHADHLHLDSELHGRSDRYRICQ